MALFNGSDIYKYFQKVSIALKNKVHSYDYRQLKDFSDEDINLIVEYFKVSEVTVDFENAKMTPRNGEGEVYNYDCEIFDDQPEYDTVSGKIITFLAPICGDHTLLECNLCEHSFESLNYHDNNYKEMNIEFDPESGIYYVKFEIFFENSRFNGKSKEELCRK